MAMTVTEAGLHSSAETYGKASEWSAFEAPPHRPVKVTAHREAPGWLPYVLRRLNALAARHGAAPKGDAPLVDIASLKRSLDILGALLDDNAPAPSVVPTVDAGVQFVWHRGGWDLEVDVLPDRTEVWGRHRETGRSFEGPLNQHREGLVDALREIGRTPVDRV